MVLGAYFASALAVDAGVPFVLSFVLAILATALLAGTVERLAMRPLAGTSEATAAIATLGIFVVLNVVAADLIGPGQRTVGDPWGLDTFSIGAVKIFENDAARVALAALTVGGLALFFARSRTGLAMRASAFSHEAALAQGVPVGRMIGLSWMLAGALGAIAGVMAATGGGGFDQTLALLALKALPVIILGGIDSIRGAIVGGLLIGVAEACCKTYQPEHAAWLGANFDQVLPYIVMLAVLLVRPYGLFGTPQVQRV